MLTQQRLQELLHYDQATGAFTSNSYPQRKSGPLGSINGRGYRHIRLDGKSYQMHRLAWLHVHGHFPDGMIDHIDGDRMNNALANLRVVTPSENLQNQRHAHADSLTGLLGVDFHKAKGRYRARIRIGGRQQDIGHYACPVAAHQAYLDKKREVHPGCTI
jgi:hypothetical protein